MPLTDSQAAPIPSRSVAVLLARVGLFIFIALRLSVASAFGVEPSPANKAEWTVMVYMNAKNSLECFGFRNFSQMADVGSNDKVNMLVDFGRPKRHLICEESPQAWSGVLRYRVTAKMKPTIQNSLPAFRRMNGPRSDMGSEKNLSEFIGWSMKQYPANHYLLIIWNHGQGFRLEFARSPRGGTAALAKATLADNRPQVSGGVRSVSFDDDSGNHLFNSDITQALRENGSQPIDVLGFDACLMAMLETGYQMKSVAHHLIGSEELEPGSGWNYTTLLKSLEGQSPTVSSLAKDLEATYQRENEEQHATLALINLDVVDSLAKAVSEWSDLLAQALKDDSKKTHERDALAKARNESKPYGKWYDNSDAALQTSVDLHRLAALDAMYSGDPGIQAAATKVVHLIEDSNLVGSRYASEDSDDQHGYGSWGLAIYFPNSLASFNADSANSPGYIVGNTDHPVLFVDKERWATLLQIYYSTQKT